MSSHPTDCPSCHHPLTTTRLRCSHCQAVLEGSFELPALLRLDPNDLGFVTAFVKASGSLKEIARQRGQSYPTIRNRLDEIIARIEEAELPAADPHAILDAIAKGTMTVAEATKKLQEVKS